MHSFHWHTHLIPLYAEFTTSTSTFGIESVFAGGGTAFFADGLPTRCQFYGQNHGKSARRWQQATGIFLKLNGYRLISNNKEAVDSIYRVIAGQME
ncbi:MAG: hypothetical protein ACK2US_18595 [Anaerolineae bacterium]